MNKKGLSILMRAKMRPNNDSSKLSSFSPSLSNGINQMMTDPPRNQRSTDDSRSKFSASGNHYERTLDIVKDSMGLAISLNKTESLDAVLDDFSQGYFSLSNENRKKLVIVLAKEYDLNRIQVRELLKQYLGLELRSGNEGELSNVDDENMFSAFYRIERNLRQALKPTYNVLFERLNNYTGGLKFLSLLRADILSFLGEENIASLRALDSCLKEKLSTWLSPAVLELHQITWDDSASLLEKIVTYEAVHPISNLLDLKRRLGVGRRCFGYFHPAIPGEPLIFIEVALLKNVAQTIQPGLAGINLGKFLIKRMITLVKRDMPQISTFATLSPIPGFMQWLLSKLASQSVIAKVDNMEPPTGGSGSTFQDNLLEPDEERMLLNSAPETYAGKNGMEVMLNLLTSKNYEWTSSAELLSALNPPLMRLCARYLLQEKKRGKALDSVANFHLQNGAMVERLNWMADRSERGLRQSGGIMVNYVYR
ncbi:malonyl-CoA decarboxylase [Populus alba x Populus x berolinensis]|nr:malonyl-CoA decarboxylase [Populus alba x Populus x berolinensis]